MRWRSFQSFFSMQSLFFQCNVCFSIFAFQSLFLNALFAFQSLFLNALFTFHPLFHSDSNPPDAILVVHSHSFASRQSARFGRAGRIGEIGLAGSRARRALRLARCRSCATSAAQRSNCAKNAVQSWKKSVGSSAGVAGSPKNCAVARKWRVVRRSRSRTSSSAEVARDMNAA